MSRWWPALGERVFWDDSFMNENSKKCEGETIDFIETTIMIFTHEAEKHGGTGAGLLRNIL